MSIREMEGGIGAVLKFSGDPTEDMAQQKAKELRCSLKKDGLKPINGCLLARYNNSARTWSFVMVTLCPFCLILCISYCLLLNWVSDFKW